MKRLFVFLALAISTAAFAGPQRAPSSIFYITGTLISFDSDSIVIRDPSKKEWKISRHVIKPGFELRPENTITVQVYSKDVRRVTLRQ